MPEETIFVEFADKKTQVTYGGSGPPLVYLHSALGETDWTPFLERLTENYTVYLPAHPGFAFSSGLEEVRTAADIAWHYVDLMKELGLESASFIGLSIGGWIGLELALLRPQLVNKLVLVGSAGIRIPEVPIGEIFVDDFAEIRELAFHDPDSDVAFEIFPDEPSERHLLGWLRSRESTARIGWNPYLHNPRLIDHLHRIDCPTLLLWGESDRIFPVDYSAKLNELLPNAKEARIPNCGHLVPMECPDAFHEQVTGFLG